MKTMIMTVMLMLAIPSAGNAIEINKDPVCGIYVRNLNILRTSYRSYAEALQKANKYVDSLDGDWHVVQTKMYMMGKQFNVMLKIVRVD